jgi:subtilisin family serine protease
MRTRVLLSGGLVLALFAATFTAAAAARSDGKAAKAGTARIDLATYDAKRWIVQLKAKPLARYARAKRGIWQAGVARPKLNLKAGLSRRYLGQVTRTQTRFAARLRKAVRGIRIERTFRVTLNGMAVDMTKKQAAKVRRMKGVLAVTPDIPYRPTMYATPAQINAPALWAQVGGQANAGRGIKVAIIDSGVYVTKDAAGNYAGNPCFDDAGYTMPAGYPKGDTRFTNKKVIVARAYFRPAPFAPPTPGNDTPIQGPGGSPHGTHVGGTVACKPNTTFGQLTLSGIAPAAYLMNYRIFYPSQSPDGFENGNGWVVEIVRAIEDAVMDGADVLSNSWGSSHQNTLAWPDPMVQAAEAAVDAGVVGVWAQGNSGPAQGTGNQPSSSDKVISVGAVSKYFAFIQATANVTGPAPVPAAAQNVDTGGAGFGPTIEGKHIGPAPYVPAMAVAKPEVPAANRNLGCSIDQGPDNVSEEARPFPAGSLTGKIALIERGVCNFSDKVYNAQRAGAIGAVIYNPAGNETLITMGAGLHATRVEINSVLVRNSNGVAMLNHYNLNPGTATMEFFHDPHSATAIGDLMASFSSRGPTQEKTIKPDVVAPGQDVVSGGYAVGPFPTPFTGFGSASGTSMATPHVAGAAALLLQLHPWWTPAMVKSALMTTATEDVFLDNAKTQRAGVLDRGAGRIDLAQAGNPGLVVDKPSLSGGETSAGQTKTFTVRAQNISGSADIWDVSGLATTAGFSIVPASSTLTLGAGETRTVTVTIGTGTGATTGNYEGSIVLVSRATGKRLHIPAWLRVIPPKSVDVLVIDADAKATGVAGDVRPAYTAMLDSLLLTYSVGFPTGPLGPLDLHKYRAVLLFTGDNASFANSGFSVAQEDALADYLDSGGRMWALGQNMALGLDSGTYHSRLDRGRLYSGYLGLAYEADSVNAAGTTGLGPFAGMVLGLSQTSVEGTSSPAFDTDTYNSRGTTKRFFQTGGGAAVSHGRSSDPTLEQERQEYLYRSVSMGFGIEGLAGGTTAAQLGDRTMDWLLDKLTVGLASASAGPGKRARLTASATSSVGAAITKYRWDFGDGSDYVTTTGPSVLHKYQHRGTYEVRIEATDSLGHTSVTHAFVGVKPKKKK